MTKERYKEYRALYTRRDEIKLTEEKFGKDVSARLKTAEARALYPNDCTYLSYRDPLNYEEAMLFVGIVGINNCVEIPLTISDILDKDEDELCSFLLAKAHEVLHEHHQREARRKGKELATHLSWMRANHPEMLKKTKETP